MNLLMASGNRCEISLLFAQFIYQWREEPGAADAKFATEAANRALGRAWRECAARGSDEQFLDGLGVASPWDSADAEIAKLRKEIDADRLAFSQRLAEEGRSRDALEAETAKLGRLVKVLSWSLPFAIWAGWLWRSMLGC